MSDYINRRLERWGVTQPASSSSSPSTPNVRVSGDYLSQRFSQWEDRALPPSRAVSGRPGSKYQPAPSPGESKLTRKLPSAKEMAPVIAEPFINRLTGKETDKESSVIGSRFLSALNNSQGARSAGYTFGEEKPSIGERLISSINNSEKAKSAGISFGNDKTRATAATPDPDKPKVRPRSVAPAKTGTLKAATPEAYNEIYTDFTTAAEAYNTDVTSDASSDLRRGNHLVAAEDFAAVVAKGEEFLKLLPRYGYTQADREAIESNVRWIISEAEAMYRQNSRFARAYESPTLRRALEESAKTPAEKKAEIGQTLDSLTAEFEEVDNQIKALEAADKTPEHGSRGFDPAKAKQDELLADLRDQRTELGGEIGELQSELEYLNGAEKWGDKWWSLDYQGQQEYMKELSDDIQAALESGKMRIVENLQAERDWLETYGGEAAGSYIRAETYAADTAELATLNEQITTLESAMAENRATAAEFGEDDPRWAELQSEYDEMAAELRPLQARAEEITVAMTSYDRTTGHMDQYLSTRFEPDFAAVSAKRDFKIPTREEFDSYDQARVKFAEDSAIAAESGSIAAGSPELVIEDKLGIYLAAGADGIKEAQDILGMQDGSTNSWADLIVTGDANGWAELTDDEIGTYYYLLNKEGQEAAYEFLDGMTTELTRRETERQLRRVYEAEGLERLGYNIASVPANIFGGALAFLDDAAHIARGEDINPYSRLHLAQTMAQATRQTTGDIIDNFTAGEPLTRDELTMLWEGKDIGHDIPEETRNRVLGISLGDVYQAGMSSLDSIFGAVLLGPTSYGTLMGMGAASSTARDYWENGASREQIIGASLLAGAAEMFFERYSVERLQALKPGDKLVLNFLKQGLAEGSEEVNTELANIITNALVMGSQSDWARAVAQYENEGFSVSASKAKALVDVGEQLWRAGVSGFISGAGSGGVYTAVGRIATAQQEDQLLMGLASKPDGVAYQIAGAINAQRADIARRMAAGEQVPESEIASLESKQDELAKALREMPADEKSKARAIVNQHNKSLTWQERHNRRLGRDLDKWAASAQAISRAAKGEQDANAAGTTEASVAPTVDAVLNGSNTPAHTELVSGALATAIGAGNPTGKQITEIMHDPASMAELNIPMTGLTNTEKRTAIKGKIIEMATTPQETQSEVSESTRADEGTLISTNALESANTGSHVANDREQRFAAFVNTARADSRYANASDAVLREIFEAIEASSAMEGRYVYIKDGNVTREVNFPQFYQMAKKQDSNRSVNAIQQIFADLYDTQSDMRATGTEMSADALSEERRGKFIYSNADRAHINYATFREYMAAHAEANEIELTEEQIAAAFDRQYAQDQQSRKHSEAARQRGLENVIRSLNRNAVLASGNIEVDVSFNRGDFAAVKGQSAKAKYIDTKDANGNVISRKIVFNGLELSSRDAVLRTLVHEIVHPATKAAGSHGRALLEAIVLTAENLADQGHLPRHIAAKVKFRKQELANLSAMYTAQDRADNGKNARPQDWTADSDNVFEEYAADLLRDILYTTKTSKALFSAKPSAAHALLGRAISIRKRMGKISAEEQELADELDNIIKLVRDALEGNVSELEIREEAARKQTTDQTATDTGAADVADEQAPNEVKNSIESMFDAGGMVALRDEDSGQISFFLKGDMTPISEVTVDHIKYASGIGLLIDTAVQNKFISKSDAQEQYKAAAELFNMILETQDPDMIWEFAGASLFSAVKTNSDGQYGTTIDFTTVCRKTQDMITAMSKAMVDLKRGLTKDAVTKLQKKLLANDAQVPCPVCYVFSRWAGVGAVLDKMYYWQNKYENATAEELQARIKQLEGLTKKADLRKQLKEDDAVYQDLAAEQEKLKQDKAKLNKALTAAKKRKTQDAETQRIQKENPAQIAAFDAKLAAIKKQMTEIEDRGSAELAWLLKVRTADNYAAVPAEVLFDLDAGKTFAAQYPVSWAYRTSRGPGVGKAILPYSDMRLGDGILGPKAADETKDGTQKRDLFKDAAGKWTTDQQKAIDRAIIRTAAQNLIGGQRFQSTSDFRYDYALDYLMAFWEMQALGSNMQTYTKVIEFVDMVAAIGGDVNMSVMPKNAGYADGKLIFSNVTGMNIEAARRANALYDNAQMILVGINDQHIRLALEDSAETGGNEIGFVIPYHASGASIENFISQLVANLNEQFVKDNYTDYSDVQTDHSRKGATEEQARRGDIRKAILTGRVGNEAWTPSAEDFLLMQGKSVDISNRSFEELRDTEKRALAGEQAAIDEYLSWSAGILQELYDRFNGSEVHLKSTQAASIMPHEYWNKSTTRANAFVNGFIFRSYCYSLGLSPRFTGVVKGGKVVDHGDFSDSTGYWKTLIDRPMYRNDGTYRDQQRINVTEFDAGMLTPAWAEERWGDYKLAEPSKTKAIKAADEFVSEVKHSIESDPVALDRDYFAAIERGDMETVQQMVDAAASAKGFPLRLLHGTQAFGFTKADVTMSDDSRSFFATSAEETARSYSSVRGVRQITQGVDEDAVGEAIAELDRRARSAAYDLADRISAFAGYRGYADGDDLYGQFTNITADYMNGEIDSADADSLMYDLADEWIAHAYSRDDYDGQEFWEWQDSDEAESLYTEVNKTIAAFLHAADFEMRADTSGNYDLYANPAGLLEIDCKGGNWNDIESEMLPDITSDEFKKYGYRGHRTLWTTRSVSHYAKDLGYSGVVFKNLRDDGGRSPDGVSMPADVYAFFNPQEQVKSADPITYDDNGNVIPLSERFNTENNDIRYSIEDVNYLVTYLAKGQSAAKYWRPRLSKSAWELIEYKKHQQLYDPRYDLDDTAKWLYAKEKGTAVFAIYSKLDENDPTVLYAVEGGRAVRTNQKIQSYLEEKTDEFTYDRESIGDLVARVLGEQNGGRSNPRNARLTGADGGNVQVPTGQPGRDGDGNRARGDENTGLDSRRAAVEEEIKRLEKRLRRTDMHPQRRRNLKRHLAELRQELESLDAEDGIVAETKYSIESDPDQNIPTLADIDELFAAANEAYDAAVERESQRHVTAAEIGSAAQTGSPVGVAIYSSAPFDDQMIADLTRIYDNIIEQYGAIPGKDANVPRRTKPNNKVSQTVATVLGAEVTPESRVPAIKQMVVDGKVSYVPKTNSKSIVAARGKINREGFQNARAEWSGRVHNGETNADLVTLGAVLLNNAGNANATGEEYVSILVDYAQLLRNAGQALQAAKVLKKLTPEGKLYAVQKVVDNINDKNRVKQTKKRGKGRAGKKNVDQNIPVEEWMQKVGEELAASIKSRLSTTDAKAKTVSQTILADLKKFSEETLPKQNRMMAKRSDMDRLRDLFENRENYEKAWAAAKKTMRVKFGAKPETMQAINAWMEQSLDYAALLTEQLTDAENVKISEKLATAYLSAETDEQRDVVLELIYRDIAAQIQATGMEKFTALRYLGMLGNFRTQIRNVVGNLAFQPIRMTNATFQGLVEALLERAGVQIERTTSALYDMPTFKEAFKEYETVRDAILSGGKYQEGDRTSEEIEKYRTIFRLNVKIRGKEYNFHPLEYYRRATNWAMDTGDSIFCSFTFADALSRYMKANHTTWSKASEELKDRARAYAIREAAEATYRDNNAFAQMISRVARAKNDTLPERIKAGVFTGVLPFRKTPANILVRAFEYSPLGLVDAAVKSIKVVKSAEGVSGSDIVRSLSKALTGTGLVALGFALASMGVLLGKAPDDDDEREFWELRGYQQYALLHDGKTYTLDWLAPESIPLFLGANLQQAALENGVSLSEILKALGSLSDPILSMSMLQGVNDALENASSYGDDSALTRFTGNAVWGYLTQIVPTILGQAERAGNNQRMATYVDKNNENIPEGIQRLLGKLSAKIPGWDYAQIVYTDAWGRMEQNAQSDTWNVINQFLSPGYSSTVETSDMEDELLRLYEATGDSGVLISSAPKYFQVDGERKDLTGDEYVTFNTERGQTAYALMTALVESDAYADMDDTAKAKAVKQIYDFATQTAKYSVTDGEYVVDKWVENTMAAAYDVDLPVESVALYKATLSVLTNEYPDGIPDGEETIDINTYLRKQLFADDSLTKEQKDALDNIVFTDGRYIVEEINVDYSNEDTFTISQNSETAQTKFENLPSRFDLDATEFTEAYSIYNNDELSATEKRAELAGITGDETTASELYTYLGKSVMDETDVSHLPEAVGSELIRLSTSDVGFEYSLTPPDNVPTSYTDPDSKVDGKATREWVLTTEQQNKYVEMRDAEFEARMTSLLNSKAYQNADDAEKCEMIEELKSEVSDTVKEDFIAWLSRNARSTPRN